MSETNDDVRAQKGGAAQNSSIPKNVAAPRENFILPQTEATVQKIIGGAQAFFVWARMGLYALYFLWALIRVFVYAEFFRLNLVIAAVAFALALFYFLENLLGVRFLKAASVALKIVWRLASLCMAVFLFKGLLDFAVLAEKPDTAKYDHLAFPQADRWGLVFPADDPLAKKTAVTADDLKGLPLFCSEQSWRVDIPGWAGDRMADLRLEGSFRLSYNGSMFALEGLGYLLTFDHLIDTSPGSGLVFRPLSPALETKLYLIWKKYQPLSPISERFLEHLKRSFET